MNNSTGLSAWKAICSLVAIVEVPTLRRVIGERLVSQCEELELELSALREILSDAGSITLLDGGGPARQLLERKIAMLLHALGDNLNERDNDSRLRSYVCERRPSPAERSYQTSSAIKRLSAYLNIDNIDLVVGDVRRLLDADVKRIQSEIELLHQSDSKGGASPSLVELRQYCSRLEDEWLRRELRHQVTTPHKGAELTFKPTLEDEWLRRELRHQVTTPHKGAELSFKPTPLRPPESSSESSTHRRSTIRLAYTLAHSSPHDVVNQKQKYSKMRSLLREARDEQHWQHW